MVGFQLPPTSTWWFVAINQFNRTNPATKNLQPPLQSQGKQAYTNRPRSVKSPEETTRVFPEKKIHLSRDLCFQPGKVEVVKPIFFKTFLNKTQVVQPNS